MSQTLSASTPQFDNLPMAKSVHPWPPRRVLQVSLVLPAFLLFSITWYEAAGLAILILLFDLFVVRQSKMGLEEGSTDSDGFLPGVILCPISMLALALIFRHSLAVVAAAWALLAVGDSVAGAIGEVRGVSPLPFNPQKTWEGFGAFVIFGGVAAFLLMLWVSAAQPNLKTFLVCLFGALVGAIVESLPIRLDDNITVPLIGGGFVFCAHLMTRVSLGYNLPYLGARIGWALIINLVFALAALGLRQITLSGAIAGFLLGFAVYMGYGYKSFLILFSFFVLGVVATRLGYARKLERGIAERRKGARSWQEAVANISPAAFFSVLVITTPYQRAFLMALVAALAEAAGDTVASEIGKWLSAQAYLITNLKPVRAGEDGGVSIAGTVAGFGASALVVILAWKLGMLQGWNVLMALAAAGAGNVADSFLGAALERRGFVTNGFVNFLGSGLAGTLALAWELHH
jgi:uncharacterized protein (TIGR00297 family)